MSFGVDASENYLTWGNTEAIRYTSHVRGVTEGTDWEYEIAIAKPRALSFKELVGSAGAYIAQDRVWLIPAKLVTEASDDGGPPLIPKAGDWLVIDEDDRAGDEAERPRNPNSPYGLARWTVLETALNTLKSTWRCVTRNLAIVYGLHDTITIRRPTVTTDDAGGRTYTYATVYEDIACRFQETSAETANERGQRLTLKRYTVPVEQQLTLKIEDQAVDQDGNIYEITGWHDTDKIDQLQQLECERRW